MQIKLLEVRDEGTTIPVLAMKIAGANEGNHAEAWLWQRAGYGHRDYVLLAVIDPCSRMEMQYDPYEWRFTRRSRTLSVAHFHIEEHFDELKSGAVVDVQYILGETRAPKQSERGA